MSANAPYYDTVVNLESNLIADLDTSSFLDNQGASEPSRYPEPTVANTHLPAQSNADLQNLVDAASAAAQAQTEGTIPGRQSTRRGAKRRFSDAHEPSVSMKQRSPQGTRRPLAPRTRASDAGSPVLSTSPTVVARPRYRPASAALFRPPSQLAQKSTRPPMSTLFESLNLGADEFLDLHARAKAFMLDLDHPERLATVGIRGRSDGKGIKLELSRCTAQFLENGIGEQFFGREAPRQLPEQQTGHPAQAAGAGTTSPSDLDASHGDQSTRMTFWPEDKGDIIALCMPLLRRIITNEKQRQYAATTRKAGKDSGVEANGASQNDGTTSATAEQHASEVTLNLFTVDAIEMSLQRGQSRKIIFPSRDRCRFEALRTSVDPKWEVQTFEVQTPMGLWPVHDDDSLRAAVGDVLRAPWLEGVVRVAVTVRTAGHGVSDQGQGREA